MSVQADSGETISKDYSFHIHCSITSLPQKYGAPRYGRDCRIYS
jgi:hypothetical protein